MRRSTLSRVARLEARQPEPLRLMHTIFIREGEDGDAISDALIAAGEADRDDRFFIYEFVSPRPEHPNSLPVMPPAQAAAVSPAQAVAAWRAVAEPYRPDGDIYTNRHADRAASVGLTYRSDAIASLRRARSSRDAS